MAGAWSLVKRLLGLSFRLLATVFMAVVVIAAGYWAWARYEDSRIAKRVSVAKTWPDLTLPMKTPTLIKLKTKCVDSQLYYQLTISPKLSPQAAASDERSAKPERSPQEAAVERLRRDIAQYSIEFLDADGFKLIQLTVKTDDLTRMVDDQGRLNSLSVDGTRSCDGQEYARVARVAVGWHER